MSIYVMTWVWKHGPKDPTERLVLLAIADHADDEGRAFPSMAGIAEKACVTERGARGIVRRLEAKGWMQVNVGGGRGGKSNYKVLMVENPECETGNDVPVNGNTERETRNVTAQNPERDCTKPGTLVPPNHQGTIKEPSEGAREAHSPSQKKSRKVAEAEVHAVLCEVISPQLASDFIEHRTGLRKPLTKRAAELIRDKLKDCPFPAAAVEASIENGWQGVFPERGQAPPQTGDSAEAAQIERYRRMRG